MKKQENKQSTTRKPVAATAGKRAGSSMTRRLAGVGTLGRTVVIGIGIGMWALWSNVVQAKDVAGGGKCDKGCMLSIANKYLDALISHDPAGVPFSPQLVSTQNRKAVKLGEGMWKTVGPSLNYRQTLVDPIAGQIVIFAGGAEVDGAPSLYFFRLKVKNRMITENEMVSVRKGDHVIFEPGNLTQPDPVFEQVLADDERSSRKELVAIAKGYFDAVTFHDPSKAPFGPDCLRVENGGRATDAYAFGAAQPSCSIQMNTMPFVVTNTRYDFVDEARGLVLGVALIHSTDAKQPGIVWIYDLFKVKSGHLRSIYALVRVPGADEPPPEKD